VGEQLFAARNRQGILAIEMADQLQNPACYQTLSVLEKHALF
jgi:hypothetical protein